MAGTSPAQRSASRPECGRRKHGHVAAPAALPELLPGTAAGRCLQAAGSQRALRCNRDRLVWHRQMQQFRATTDTGLRLGFSPPLLGCRAAEL